jgi:hypothetical protein
MHDRLSASDITTATEIILITSDIMGCYYHSLTHTTFGHSPTKLKEKLQRCANDGYHGENLFKP